MGDSVQTCCFPGCKIESSRVSWGVLDCGHFVHEICVNHWWKLQKTCPLCRGGPGPIHSEPLWVKELKPLHQEGVRQNAHNFVSRMPFPYLGPPYNEVDEMAFDIASTEKYYSMLALCWINDSNYQHFSQDELDLHSQRFNDSLKNIEIKRKAFKNAELLRDEWYSNYLIDVAKLKRFKQSTI